MKNHDLISIRMAQESDVSEILGIYAPYILNTSVSFETAVPDIPEFSMRIKRIQEVLPWLVCAFDDKIAGYAYASDHRSRKAYQWTKELSVYVHHGFKNRGIGTALYVTLIDLLRLQGIVNCLAGIALPNESSIRFHEKLGFRPVGTYHNVGYKSGKFCDVGWWELFIAENGRIPGEIIPVSAIEGSPDFELATKKGLTHIKRS